MRDIAKLTFKRDDFLIVMTTLMKRLNEPGKNWRHVYKALLVIDYILKNGSRDVESYCRQHIVEIRTLTRFQYIDQSVNKDVGINVRERTKIVLELLSDSAKLETERKRSAAARNKYVGVSSEDSMYGGRSYSSSSSTSISYDDPYDEYGSHDYGRDSDVPSTSPAVPSDGEGEDNGYGMSSGVAYDYDYADSSFAQRKNVEEKKEPKQEPPKPQNNVMFDLFGDAPSTTTTTTTTTTTSAGGSFFDLAPAPAPAATTTTNNNTMGGSFFDMAPAPAATTTTTTNNTMGGSFFDMAPAPAASTQNDPFFGGSASVGVSTGNTYNNNSNSSFGKSNDPFPAAFGDFESAGNKSATTTTTTTAATAGKGGASFDVLSMVNLDSLGAKPATTTPAQSAPMGATTTMGGAQRRTPMGAMGPATGPAFVASGNAMGAPSGSILTPTAAPMQPNYAALSQPQQPQQPQGMYGGYAGYGGYSGYGAYGMQQQQPQNGFF